MRGLLMAFLALTASGLQPVGERARVRSAKTPAQKTTVTTV